MPLEKRVWDMMDAQFTFVTPETPLKEACAIFSTGNKKTPGGISSLVVMRSSGEYLGLLTARDILQYLMDLYNKQKGVSGRRAWLETLSDRCEDGSLVTVNDVMVFFEVEVKPIQKLEEALALMLEHELDALPVVDAGKVLGLIRGPDILGEIAREIK